MGRGRVADVLGALEHPVYNNIFNHFFLVMKICKFVVEKKFFFVIDCFRYQIITDRGRVFIMKSAYHCINITYGVMQ